MSISSRMFLALKRFSQIYADELTKTTYDTSTPIMLMYWEQKKR